uniref:Reverse transcriptase domain-containing protein n=1 Tax=Brassica oleracea var. oleracea TaxID=109376 RepID=A0A0D3CDK3_BRAOL
MCQTIASFDATRTFLTPTVLVQLRVSSQNQQSMVLLPTAKEIQRLFFRLNPNKASGPDGLTSGFLRSSWDIIGKEVILANKQLFTSCLLPPDINATILSLVPAKRQGTTYVTDYHLISCLNTVY